MSKANNSRMIFEHIIHFARLCKINMSCLIQTSPRQTISVYSELCRCFKVKNNFKNRLKFYVVCRNNRDKIQELLLNNQLEGSSEPRERLEGSENSNSTIYSSFEDTVDISSVATTHFDLKSKTTESIHNINSSKYVNKFEVLFKENFKRVQENYDLCIDSEARHCFWRKKIPSFMVTCILIFKGHRINKKRNDENFTLIEYANCKQSNCRLYKFVYKVFDEYFDLHLYYRGPKVVNHLEEYSYRLSGREREEVKKVLKNTFPNTLRCDKIAEADQGLLHEGNWQNLRSLSVYQKTRSEALSEEDKHPDPFLDIILRSMAEHSENKYIQFPDGKTLVHMFSKEQIRILIERGKKIDAYLDATGSLIRPTVYDKGCRVLYYALVTNIRGKIIPIAELISSSQDSATITSFLLKFKRFVTLTCFKTWPVFNVVVTDWSFALMTSVCQGFNEMTLYTYLQVCFKFVTNLDDSQSFSLIKLKSCCSHFIKMICNQLSRSNKSKNAKNGLVNSIAVLLQCSSLEELTFQFRNVVIILKSSVSDSDVEYALKELSSDSYDNSEIFFNFRDEFSSEEIDNIDEGKVRGDYTTSPFFLYFFKIYTDVMESIEKKIYPTECPGNIYKSDEFCEYLLKRIMPFAPLWTNIMRCGRYSNSNVECWYKIVKKDIFSGKSNQKLGRFVSEVHKRIRSDLKSLEFDIGTTPKRKKKLMKDDEIDKPNALEQWRKVKKQKRYFQKKCLAFPTEIDSKNEEKSLDKKSLICEDKFEDDEGTTEIDSRENCVHDVHNVGRNDNITSHNRQALKSSLKNGLIFSNDYYIIASKKISFIIGQYKYNNFTLSLSSADFKTLDKGAMNSNLKDDFDTDRWLSDYCIDSMAFSVLRNRSDTFYIDTISSHLIFTENYQELSRFSPLIKSFENIKYVVLTHNQSGNHWVLIIMDLINFVGYILNPAYSYTVLDSRLLGRLERYMNARNKFHPEYTNTRQWTLAKLPIGNYQQESDSRNCGVYVIFYITLLSQCANIRDFFCSLLESSFDPEEFRLTIQQVLLIASEKMYDNCLVCGMKVNNNHIRCQRCDRSLHIEKCSNIIPEFSAEQMELPAVYICPVCEVFDQNAFSVGSISTKSDVEKLNTIHILCQKYLPYMLHS